MLKQSPKEIKLITSGIVEIIKPQDSITYLVCRGAYWSLHIINDHLVEVNVVKATIKVDDDIWDINNPENFDKIKRLLDD